MRIDYSPPRRPPEGVRELSWPEVHLLRAGLWDWGDDKGRAAAGAELDRIEPGFRLVPEFLMMKAAWLEAGKRATEARVLLESALKAHPDDPRLLNAMGYALLGTVEGKDATADAEAALQKVADQLAPLARTAAQDHLIAKARARKGALALAMAHEKRAISRDPNCIQCLASLAELFDRRGRWRMPWPRRYSRTACCWRESARPSCPSRSSVTGPSWPADPAPGQARTSARLKQDPPPLNLPPMSSGEKDSGDKPHGFAVSDRRIVHGKPGRPANPIRRRAPPRQPPPRRAPPRPTPRLHPRPDPRPNQRRAPAACPRSTSRRSCCRWAARR